MEINFFANRDKIRALAFFASCIALEKTYRARFYLLKAALTSKFCQFKNMVCSVACVKNLPQNVEAAQLEPTVIIAKDWNINNCV